MLNKRLSVARAVMAELHPAEAELDNAILHASRLAIAVLEGRQNARLPINVGQEGLGGAVKAAGHLVEARAALIAAHVAFQKDKEEIGLRAVAVGDLWDCPKAMALDVLDAANAA
jgi:hypothetical protein